MWEATLMNFRKVIIRKAGKKSKCGPNNTQSCEIQFFITNINVLDKP